MPSDPSVLTGGRPRPPSTDALVKMRSGQRRLFQLVEQYRLLGFIARRQYGKTTTCANIALMKMMKNRDHTVIFGSAKLNLSREIVRKEAAVFEKAINAALSRIEAGKLQLADDKTGRGLTNLTSDDFADLFEHTNVVKQIPCTALNAVTKTDSLDA